MGIQLFTSRRERKSTNYDFDNIQYNMNAGHMQQVLWIPTTKVGVGITTAFDKTWIVARYKPPGNSQRTNLNQFINKPIKGEKFFNENLTEI